MEGIHGKKILGNNVHKLKLGDKLDISEGFNQQINFKKEFVFTEEEWEDLKIILYAGFSVLETMQHNRTAERKKLIQRAKRIAIFVTPRLKQI